MESLGKGSSGFRKNGIEGALLLPGEFQVQVPCRAQVDRTADGAQRPHALG